MTAVMSELAAWIHKNYDETSVSIDIADNDIYIYANVSIDLTDRDYQ